jgi:hypothetical protein
VNKPAIACLYTGYHVAYDVDTVVSVSVRSEVTLGVEWPMSHVTESFVDIALRQAIERELDS